MGGNASTSTGVPSAAESAAACAAWGEALSSVHGGVVPNVALTGQQLGPAAVLGLCRALEGNTTVKQLELDRNRIGDKGATHLGEALKRNRAIGVLDISGNDIGHSGASALAEGLEGNISLTHLELGNNRISGPGAERLARAIGESTSIRQVSLSDNLLGPQGGKAIGSALEINKTIVILSLRNAALGVEGSSAIARALAQQSSTVKELSLGKNRILDQGAMEFGEMLKVNQVLKELYLEDNRFGDTGAAVIAEGVAVNEILTTLWMVRNDLSRQLVIKFASSLKLNRALKRLGISCKGGTMTASSRGAIDDAFRERRQQERAKAAASKASTRAPSEDEGASVTDTPIASARRRSDSLPAASSLLLARGQEVFCATRLRDLDGDHLSDEVSDDLLSSMDAAAKHGVPVSTTQEIAALNDRLEAFTSKREETTIRVAVNVNPERVTLDDRSDDANVSLDAMRNLTTEIDI